MIQRFIAFLITFLLFDFAISTGESLNFYNKATELENYYDITVDPIVHFTSFVELNAGSFYLKLSWNFDDVQQIVNMVMESNTKSYFSIGFGSKMTSAVDMWTVEQSGSTIKLSDQLSKSHNTPPNDETQGGKNDLVFDGVDFSGNTKVQFHRAYNTNDKNDIVLKQQTVQATWACGVAGTIVKNNR